MIVEVSIPSSMIMRHNFPVETVVGSHLQASVTMKSDNGDGISSSQFIRTKFLYEKKKPKHSLCCGGL